MKNKNSLLIVSVMLIAVLSGCSILVPKSNSEKSLTIYCYPLSGGWKHVYNDLVKPHFENDLGTKINYIEGSSLESIAKVEAAGDHPQADVTCLDDGPQAVAVSKGLLEKNDMTILTNGKHLSDHAKQPGNYGIAHSTIAGGLVYNTEAYKKAGIKAPTSFSDMENPKLKSHVVLTDISNTQGISMLVSLAKKNGGSEDDMNSGFVAAEKVARNAMAITKNDDVAKYFESDGAWISLWHSVGASQYIEQSDMPLKFVYPKSGASAISQVSSVIKNAPHKKLGFEFMNYLLSDEVQKEYIKYGYSASRSDLKSNKRGEPELASYDWKKINEDRAKWTKRWNSSVLPLVD